MSPPGVTPKVKLLPAHTGLLVDILIDGNGLMVTALEVVHPPTKVYTNVVLPADTPTAVPLDGSMLPKAGDVLLQVPPAVDGT